ncbi:oxidoreductase [Pseudonocardia sp. CNS-004]|nr:oxidoreductase [Pseudonocardia sp. CNS-004]
MGRLAGKVAFITGGARGQGRAHALRLAEEGADIVIVDLEDQVATVPYDLARDGDLDETAALVEKLDRRAVAVKADVRDQSQLDAAVAEGLAAFGQLDIVCANAGIWSRAPLHELTENAWQDMIDINLTGVWRTIKATVPHLIERRQGSIIVTGSTNAVRGGPGYAHYVSAKHGVMGLMKSAALEYGVFGIRVNAVCPGFVDSKMTDWQGCYEMTTGRPDGTRQEHMRAAHHSTALADVGMLAPGAISEGVLWLASDESRFVTGAIVPVDAGHLALPGFNGSPVISDVAV